MNSLRQHEGKQSLAEKKAIRATWLLLANMPVTIRDQKMADTGGAFLRGLAIERQCLMTSSLGQVGLISQET